MFRVFSPFQYYTLGSGEDNGKLIQYLTRHYKLNLVTEFSKLQNYASIYIPLVTWTELQSCNESNSFAVMTVKALLADGPINLRILLLKILRLFEFLIFRSRYSIL